MAGAMLLPIVSTAQAIAANTEKNWLRVDTVISNSFHIAHRAVCVSFFAYMDNIA